MIETPSAVRDPHRLPRHLMVSGLGLWGAGVGGALAPRVLRAIVYPNQAEERPFDLVAGQPLASPLVWAGLVVWCLTWAFVFGYLATAFSARNGRPSWASPALLLSSLASPLVFGLAVSVLLRLATHDAYHGGNVVSFLPAVAVQLAISQAYSLMTGRFPRAALEQRMEAA